MDYDDSDQATGLPPLDEPDPGDGMIMTSHAVSEGLIAHPKGDQAVVFLSVRGLVRDDRARSGVGWAQFHIGVPHEQLPKLIAELSMGLGE